MTQTFDITPESRPDLWQRLQPPAASPPVKLMRYEREKTDPHIHWNCHPTPSAEQIDHAERLIQRDRVDLSFYYWEHHGLPNTCWETWYGIFCDYPNESAPSSH